MIGENRLEGLDAELAVAALLVDAHVQNVTGRRVELSLLEGLRTAQRQRELFARGRTAPGRIVTHTLNSRHLSGQALDLTLAVGGRSVAPDDVDRQDYATLAALFRSLLGARFRWGGEFSRIADLVHFEVTSEPRQRLVRTDDGLWTVV